jgi:hypothetical protein
MMMVAPVGLPGKSVDRERSGTLVQRLSEEFVPISPETVERCVNDVQACVTHLGMDATPALVERIVREHLVGMVMSEPPSGRYH